MKDQDFELAIGYAKQQLMSNGSHIPMFTAFGYDASGKREVQLRIAAPIEGDNFDEAERSKNVICRKVKDIFRSHKVDKYVFISEAWMKVFAKDGAEYRNKPRSLENEPGRIEVLFCNLITRTTRKSASFEMVRDRKGKLIELREIESELGKLSGRFAELLDD